MSKFATAQACVEASWALTLYKTHDHGKQITRQGCFSGHDHGIPWGWTVLLNSRVFRAQPFDDVGGPRHYKNQFFLASYRRWVVGHQPALPMPCSGF